MSRLVHNQLGETLGLLTFATLGSFLVQGCDDRISSKVTGETVITREIDEDEKGLKGSKFPDRSNLLAEE